MLTAYRDALRATQSNAQTILLITAIMGFTIDGGIYSVVLNLFILRLNFGPEFVGQLNSAANLIFAVGSLAAGWLGGRYGNHRLMVAGLVAAVVGSITFPLADLIQPSHAASGLSLALMAVYIGLALYYVNAAPFLLRATAPQARGAIFAIQSAVSGFASFAGGLAGGLLPAFFVATLAVTTLSPTPYRLPLLLVAGLLTLALLLVLRLPHPEADAAELAGVEAKPGAPRPRSAYSLILLMSLVRFLQVAGVGAAVTFFNVYLDTMLHVATPTIGLIAASARLCAVPAALLGPLLARRMGYGTAAVVGSFGAVLSLLPLALIQTPWAAGLGFIGLLAFTSIRYPTFYIFIMELTPPRLRATMTGTGEMSAGFSFALISLVGGFTIVRFGYTATFLLAATMTLAGTLLLAAYVWWLAKNPEASQLSPPPLQETAIISPLVGHPPLEHEQEAKEGRP